MKFQKLGNTDIDVSRGCIRHMGTWRRQCLDGRRFYSRGTRNACLTFVMNMA